MVTEPLTIYDLIISQISLVVTEPLTIYDLIISQARMMVAKPDLHLIIYLQSSLFPKGMLKCRLKLFLLLGKFTSATSKTSSVCTLPGGGGWGEKQLQRKSNIDKNQNHGISSYTQTTHIQMNPPPKKVLIISLKYT